MAPLSVEIQLSYFIQPMSYFIHVPEITLRETFGVSRTLLGVLDKALIIALTISNHSLDPVLFYSVDVYFIRVH